MTDLAAVRSLVLDTLKGDAQLTAVLEEAPGDGGAGIFAGAVPEGALLPAAAVDFVPLGDDVNPQGIQTQVSRVLVVAKVLESFDRTEAPEDEHPAVPRMEALLKGLSGVVGGFSIRLRRTGSHFEEQNDSTNRNRQSGGRYMAEVSHPLN